jgi:hypothetical protein
VFRRVFSPLAVWLAGLFLECDAMARPATEYRNEAKTRLTDPAYAVVQHVMHLQGISESRAIALLVERGAFGMVGTLPTTLDHNSPETAINGPVMIR